MLHIIIFILLLTCFIAFVLLSTYMKNINKITVALKDIIHGTPCRRINPGTVSKSINSLSTEINTLLDQYEESSSMVHSFEMSQKRVISNISHDICTPLTSLLGYLEMLQRDTSLSEDEKNNFLKIAISKGETLNVLVQNFFELARIEADDKQNTFQRIDMSNAIKEVMLGFYSGFLQNKIQPRLDLPEKPIYVWADRASIDRILQNLISNALRYGKDGGIIGVDLREEYDKLWVDVWDCGKGIPEKDTKYIFERLYTADESRNNGFRGSGLGLSIAKRIVEKMDGEIFVNSIPNVKTIFSFYLPRNNSK